jgi:hypothetical protein
MPAFMLPAIIAFIISVVDIAAPDENESDWDKFGTLATYAFLLIWFVIALLS